MTRGWTEIENDPRWKDESHYDKVKERCDVLAQKWSEIHDASEQRHFYRLSEWDQGNYNMEPEEWEAMKYQETVQDDLDRIAIAAVEEKLHALGARMMRPYEHWNEDERYMEYMENRGY